MAQALSTACLCAHITTPRIVIMSTNTPSSASDTNTSDQTTDTRVFVKIPKAGPGQGYKAPKNYAHPTIEGLGKALVWLMCAALVVAPAFVVGWICFAPNSHVLQEGFAWLWIAMFLLTESIAIFCAIGIYREAVGSAGTRYTN